MFSRWRAYLGWFSVFLASQCVFAISSSHQGEISPYLPCFWMSGNSDTDQITRIEASILQPIFVQRNGLSYLSLHAIQYNPNWTSWMIGLGIGYRCQINESQQGAYFFLEHYRSPLKNGFWMLNPGIELSIRPWKFQSNVYFPIQCKSQQAERVVWGNEVGIHTHHYFKAHTEYDAQYVCTEKQKWSVDFKLIRHVGIFSFCLGGYYIERSKVLDSGFIAGFEYKMNPYVNLSVQYSYDHLHQHAVDFRVRLNSRPLYNQETRDLQPVDRHFASKWINSDIMFEPQGTASQSLENKQEDEKTPISISKPTFTDNIFFFRKDSDTGNDNPITEESCTWEQPCSAVHFTQSTLDLVQKKRPNTNFFLAEGTEYGNGRLLHLRSGQSIYGRTTDFKTVPEILNRPKIIGSLNLSNATRLEHIEVLNDKHKMIGVDIRGVDGVLLKNVSISSIENDSETYRYAVFIKNSHNVLMDSLLIKIKDVDKREGGRGIYLENSKDIRIQDSKIILGDHDRAVWGLYIRDSSLIAINNELEVHSDRDRALGIEIIGRNSHLTLMRNKIKVQGNAVGKVYSKEGVGLLLYWGNPTVKAIDNQFTIITKSVNPATGIAGVEQKTGNLTMQGNRFDFYAPLGGATIKPTIPKKSGIPDIIPDTELNTEYQDEQDNRFVRKLLEDTRPTAKGIIAHEVEAN